MMKRWITGLIAIMAASPIYAGGINPPPYLWDCSKSLNSHLYIDNSNAMFLLQSSFFQAHSYIEQISKNETDRKQAYNGMLYEKALNKLNESEGHIMDATQTAAGLAEENPYYLRQASTLKDLLAVVVEINKLSASPIAYKAIIEKEFQQSHFYNGRLSGLRKLNGQFIRLIGELNIEYVSFVETHNTRKCP